MDLQKGFAFRETLSLDQRLLGSIEPIEQSYDGETGLAAALVVIERRDFAEQAAREIAEIAGRIIGFCDPFCRDKSVADPAAWPQLAPLIKTI